jgi:ABC-type phosphate transport system substrate-binding protein
VTTEASRIATRPPRRSAPSKRSAPREGVASIPAILGLAAVLALAAGTPHPAGARAPAAAIDFVVVVNAANPQTALPAAEVSNLFLQKVHKWESGERVRPVDLPETSPARESFSKAIHGRPTAAVKAYWQRMIFSGIDAPPPEKPSAAEVLAYVRANPGAIGYVPAGTQLPEGVKALKVTS